MLSDLKEFLCLSILATGKWPRNCPGEIALFLTCVSARKSYHITSKRIQSKHLGPKVQIKTQTADSKVKISWYLSIS